MTLRLLRRVRAHRETLGARGAPAVTLEVEPDGTAVLVAGDQRVELTATQALRVERVLRAQRLTRERATGWRRR